MQPVPLEPVLEISRAALVDLDSSFLIQIVVFLVTAVLLNKIIFQPLMRVQELRESRTRGAVRDAERADKEARDRIAKWEVQVDEARRAGAARLNQIREQAAADSHKQTEAARAQADATLSEAISRLGATYETSRAELQARGTELSQLIVDKVLSPARPPAGQPAGHTARG